MAYYPDFKHLMTTPQYGFLRTEPRLGRRIMLLGLGGSYAYGTNNENSDIDFRGITLNMPSDLIGLTDFEQYEDSGTDTVIYSFNKMVKLLLECNPNTCEILRRVLLRDNAIPAKRDPETGIYPSYSAYRGGCATSSVPAVYPVWGQ